MKKNRICTIVALTTIFLLLLGRFLYQKVTVQNVFDEMFYSEARVFMRPTGTSFSKVDIIQNKPYSSIYFAEGFSDFTLDSISLQPHEEYEISIDRENSAIYFSYIFKTHNGTYHFEQTYDVQTKSLYRSNLCLSGYTSLQGRYFLNTDDMEILNEFFENSRITEKQLIQRANDIIFGTLIPSWVQGNKGQSRFAIDNLGVLIK